MPKFLSILLLVAMLGCNSASKRETAEPIEIPPGATVVKLKISGMTCPVRCVAHVKGSLEHCRGVVKVHINFPEKIATVIGDHSIDSANLIEAVNQSKVYSAELLQ